MLYPSPKPISPDMWSGSPYGLATGLEALGVEVVPLGARLPPGAQEAMALWSRTPGGRGAIAERTPMRIWSRTTVLRRRVRQQAPALDAVIAMGLELFDLRSVRVEGLPVATFDDATLLQMWCEPESNIASSGFPATQVERWIDQQRRGASTADVCCVSTQYAAGSFVADYGVAPERVAVVGMGHRPRKNPAGGERDWSRPRFLFVGVEWRRKNGQRVLEAFERLRCTHPEATLDLVGTHPFVERAGVRDHGFLPRDSPTAQQTLDQLYSTATAFVLPSRYDLSPVAYLEAASAGLPVIGSSTGGAHEVLGDATIAVPPDDVDALTEAMTKVSDPATAQRMGSRAAEAAARNSWPHVARRILAALEEDRGHGSED